MLDNTTKKRIDDCRDILVGKLPDPKSQIEQITIALIYKFMDDMDKEAIELGGEAKFFSGDYAKYSWDALFDTKVTATEMLKLYAAAIESMEKNPNIPQLFRDIFKNAYLPYRDPETLKLFLKTIGEFEYTHSEKLGDAFEYLLSVMGSQGDAGQFRTPRHIIDFLVEAVDPQKTDTILDPACGTAGFLISAFRYIINSEDAMHRVSGVSASDNRGSGLTPDERKKLINNFTGYDISPDMVRLSLVNLYLHGFSNPHIYEYDTLTSEERWNDTFDVILANPPFMTPKGGIRPHKRFTVSSNRSEVLFVDYIAEHLNPNGRAGVIVPEGVIFQSGKAYKELRKMLVENYLYAVVSLPAGVFNPYSGVKTSILLMDKALAKKTNKILFVKIENDGFSLGAQRTPVKGGQLGEAIEVLKQLKNQCLSELVSETAASEAETLKQVQGDYGTLAHTVEKSKIAENGEYNLSGERYKEQAVIHSDWPLVELGDVIVLEYGKPLKKSDRKGGEFPVFGSNGVVGWHNEHLVKGPFIVVGRKGSAGAVTFSEKSGFPIDTTFYVKIKDKRKLSLKFIYHILKGLHLDKINTQSGIPGLNRNDAYVIKIPLPPLSVQEEIVAEIEGYQKIIDGAKQVVENYKPKIDIDPDWEMVELGEVCEVNPKKSELKNISQEIEVSFVPMADLNENQVDFVPKEKKKLKDVIKGYTYFKENDVLLAKVTPCFENGKAGIAKNLVNGIGFGSSEYYVFRPNENILSMWIYLNITDNNFRLAGKLNMTGTGGLQRVPKSYVITSKIPLPPLETQKQIVAQIEKEQQLVNANKELIKIFEQKIKDRIAKVWGTLPGTSEEKKQEENKLHSSAERSRSGTTEQSRSGNTELSRSIAAEPQAAYKK